MLTNLTLLKTKFCSYCYVFCYLNLVATKAANAKSYRRQIKTQNYRIHFEKYIIYRKKPKHKLIASKTRCKLNQSYDESIKFIRLKPK